MIRRRHRPFLAGLLLLGVLYALGAWRYADRGFISPQVAVNLLGDRAVLGILAVGMTFVILSGGIDLSVGALMTLGAMMLGVLLVEHHWSLPPAIAAVLLMGMLFGAAQGAIIHASGLRPFIVTLGGMFVARGTAFLVHGESLAITHEDHGRLALWGLDLPGMRIPLTAMVFVGVVATGWYLASRTQWGRNVYALGGDEAAAALMGVPVGRTRVLVYAVSGTASALAGVTLTFYLMSANHVEGVGMELDAIAAVVLGGTLLRGGVGSIPGTLVGVLTIALILGAVAYEGGLASGSTRLLIATLLLVFVLLQRLLAGRDTAG